MSEREVIAWSFPQSVGHSFFPWVVDLFVFPLPNAQLDLTKRKLSSNGLANVKHSEIIMDFNNGFY